MLVRLESKGGERSFLLSHAIRSHGILHVRTVRSIPAAARRVSSPDCFPVRRENEISFSDRADCERSNMVTSGDALKAIHIRGIIFYAVRW